ncbi:MAG: hypothetical protein Q4P11_06880 [Methanobrevibacter sp.]|nr:hypothetical protein [Methanobrevibacter sp.]
MKDNYLPEIFEISYKDEFNGTKSIKLLNNALLVRNPNPELIDMTKISGEKWIRFWENLEKIGLWDIKEEYVGCTLDGGFSWKIKILYKNREINSYGANMEPKIVIGDKIHSVLEELYKSIEELISLE